MRLPPCLALLLLSGCDGCAPVEEVPTRVTALDPAAVGLYVADAQGVGGTTTVVFATNEVGAAVPAGAITLSSTATVAASPVEPDGHGYAAVTVTHELVGAYSVEAAVGGLTGSGRVFSTARADVLAGFPAWLSGGEGSPLAAAGEGMVVARGAEVWWASAAGGSPVRVAALTSAVREAMAVHLDGDGVADLMVWSDDELVLLRGRAGGGLSFQAGWRGADGRQVRAAVVVDGDEDALADVVMVVGDANRSSVVWMPGDGQGGWAPSTVLDEDYGTHGVTVEDLDEDGVGEVTLLTGDGVTRRYEWQGDGWQASSTMDTELGVAEGALVRGGFDIDGDLRDDLLVVGPQVDGSGASGYLVMADGGTGTVHHVTSSLELLAPLEWLAASVVDADNDGGIDIVLAWPDGLGRAVWSDIAQSFVLNLHSGLPTATRIDTPDLDGSGVPDLVFSGVAAGALYMEQVADDPETEADETVAWRALKAYDGVFDLGIEADPWAGDLDGDGVVDLVAFVPGGVQVFVGVAATETSSATLDAAAPAAFAVGETAVDLAVCGDKVWVLVDGATGTVLRRYTLGAGGSLGNAQDLPTGGDYVVCGELDGAVAVVGGTDGTQAWVDENLGLRTDAGESGWGDMVAADRDGDGVAEVVGCAGTCSAASGDVDGDGTVDWAWSDGTETTVSIGGLESSLGFGGAVSAGDADGDGVPEVVVHSGGVVAWWRGLGGVPGVPVLSFVARPTLGRAIVGDLDGNGVPDVFWRADDLDLEDTSDWTGVLLYAEAPDA